MIAIDKDVMPVLIVLIALFGIVLANQIAIMYIRTPKKQKKQYSDWHLERHIANHDALYELLADFQHVHGIDTLTVLDTPIYKLFDWSKDNVAETNHDIPHPVFGGNE